MKHITPRQFCGIGLAILVFLYGFAIFRLIDTGWYNNATTTTLIAVGVLIGVAGAILWNLVASFLNYKKVSK